MRNTKTRELNPLAKPLSLNQTFAEADAAVELPPVKEYTVFVTNSVGLEHNYGPHTQAEAQRIYDALTERANRLTTDVDIWIEEGIA